MVTDPTWAVKSVNAGRSEMQRRLAYIEAPTDSQHRFDAHAQEARRFRNPESQDCRTNRLANLRC